MVVKTFLNDTAKSAYEEVEMDSKTLPLVFYYQLEQATCTDSQRWTPYKPGTKFRRNADKTRIELANKY